MTGDRVDHLTPLLEAAVHSYLHPFDLRPLVHLDGPNFRGSEVIVRYDDAVSSKDFREVKGSVGSRLHGAYVPCFGPNLRTGDRG
ncbi:MAG TPA: hypothetical protein VFD71_08860 [Planctomycetota bacterium]|nr:hypothetical protein [Planctomycetota bacterium]